MNMHTAFICALGLCAVMSVILFIMMGSDKARAKSGARRIPERRLFGFAIFGGGVGGWLGMRVFHHKTRHWYFKFGFPALALIQLAALAYLWINA